MSDIVALLPGAGCRCSPQQPSDRGKHVIEGSDDALRMQACYTKGSWATERVLNPSNSSVQGHSSNQQSTRMGDQQPLVLVVGTTGTTGGSVTDAILATGVFVCTIIHIII